MPARQRNTLNQARGQSFERLLAFMAERNGLMAVPNGQLVRWLAGGKKVAVKCNLDWTLLYRGQAIFADTKCFAGAYFTYSQIDSRQQALAMRYFAQGFVAGFIVNLRATRGVHFVPAQMIASGGPRSRFVGTALGHEGNFDLRRLFAGEAADAN